MVQVQLVDDLPLCNLGSSVVRAPARIAGDLGSSPGPVCTFSDFYLCDLLVVLSSFEAHRRIETWKWASLQPFQSLCSIESHLIARVPQCVCTDGHPPLKTPQQLVPRNLLFNHSVLSAQLCLLYACINLSVPPLLYSQVTFTPWFRSNYILAGHACVGWSQDPCLMQSGPMLLSSSPSSI